MRIALIGGTGNIGEGLALKLAERHEVIVGSRFEEKAEKCARDYEEFLKKCGIEANCRCAINEEAAKGCDLAILAIPYRHLEDTLDELAEPLDGKTVVSPCVPMEWIDGEMIYTGFERSAAEEVAEALPGSSVVSAFHSLSAPRLKGVPIEVEMDVVVCGDDDGAKAQVVEVIEGIEGLNPRDGGSLRASRMVEAITPLLINIGERSGGQGLGIRFV